MADSSLTLVLEGAAEVEAKIGKALRALSGRAEAGLYQVAEQEMTESKKRVPVDLGNLKNSGHVTLPTRDINGISATMGFGGPAGAGNHGGVSNKDDVGYAIVVHEDLEAFHKVGEAKFLESVLRESAPYLLERIAKRITL